jgi:hypothetical protein
VELDEAVPMLRRLAAWDRELPAVPWRAAELSDLELKGPALFDPDVDITREMLEHSERRRAEHAAWRGLVDAHGVPVRGEQLLGGRPSEVVDPVWRALAEFRNAIPQLLELVRQLWPRPENSARDETPVTSDQPPPPAVDLEAAAAAAYGALDTGRQPVAFGLLPVALQQEWRARAAAVLELAGVGITN